MTIYLLLLMHSDDIIITKISDYLKHSYNITHCTSLARFHGLHLRVLGQCMVQSGIGLISRMHGWLLYGRSGMPVLGLVRSSRESRLRSLRPGCRRFRRIFFGLLVFVRHRICFLKLCPTLPLLLLSIRAVFCIFREVIGLTPYFYRIKITYLHQNSDMALRSSIPCYWA